MIRIVDYGSGNLRSVQKAFQSLGHDAMVSSRPEDFAPSDRLVLPGQGAFADCALGLAESGLREVVLGHIAADRPLLGVCVGLQLLFEVGREDGETPGLGVLTGEVVKFAGPAFAAEPRDRPGRLKIPLMGWCPLLPPPAGRWTTRRSSAGSGRTRTSTSFTATTPRAPTRRSSPPRPITAAGSSPRSGGAR